MAKTTRSETPGRRTSYCWQVRNARLPLGQTHQLTRAVRDAAYVVKRANGRGGRQVLEQPFHASQHVLLSLARIGYVDETQRDVVSAHQRHDAFIVEAIARGLMLRRRARGVRILAGVQGLVWNAALVLALRTLSGRHKSLLHVRDAPRLELVDRLVLESGAVAGLCVVTVRKVSVACNVEIEASARALACARN